MAKGSDHLQEYIGDIRRQLATGVAAEHAYRPAMKRLLEAHRTRIVAVNDPRREKCGAPDFIVQKDKVPLGYLECKDIGADLPKVLKTDQLKRYLESLGNLILTDYLEFRWFVHGAEGARDFQKSLDKCIPVTTIAAILGVRAAWHRNRKRQARGVSG